MWKIAFIAFLCVTPYFASAGRLSRSDEDDQGCLPGEDCQGKENCEECRCPVGEVFVGEMCYKLATESQNECSIQEQCNNITGSICSTGICVGQTGLGESCTMALECDPSKNLTCESGVCVCVAGALEIDGRCLYEDNLCANGTCHDNETSECTYETDGKCQCKEGFVLSDGGDSCLKEAEELGEECESVNQCKKLNATCEEGICKALLLSSVLVPALSNPAVIASECKDDEDCKRVDNAICKESICQCRNDFFQSEDQSRCIPFASKAGDPCQTDKQCSKINKSTCIDGKCSLVAAAGMHTRKNGSPSSFAASVGVIATVVAATRILFV